MRVFRAAIRRMIAADPLPEYGLAEEPGDVICVTRRRLVEPDAAAAAGPGAPLLAAETAAAARALAPGWDVYALEAEWRGFWAARGRPRLGDPDRAYLAWLAGRLRRG